jgi:hypothetical protein
VTRNIQVGSNGVQLQAGDLLLSTDADETIDSVKYHKRSVFVFRPSTEGDYGTGSFFLLIDGADLGFSNVTAISLVEQTTTVGDVTLNPGEFLVADDSEAKRIVRFSPGSLGDVTTGTTSILVEGADIDIDQSIGGLHVVQSSTVLGGVSLQAGQLLVSLQGDDSAVGDVPTIDAPRQDIFVLDVTATGQGTTAATASRLFEGAEQQLDNNNETIWGISLIGNADPEAQAAVWTLDENSANGVSVGTVSATDPEQGAMSYAIRSGNADGAFAIDATTGEITVANSAALDYETTPSFSLTVAAIDEFGAYAEATVTIDLNNVNEAPVNTSTCCPRPAAARRW